MKELKTSNGSIVLLDDEDYDRLNQFSWFCKDTGLVGRCTHRNGKPYNIAIASEVMQDYNSMFDHKDRNPLNNQKYNLRQSNASQNQFNKAKYSLNATSKFKGVSWNATKQKWHARIKHLRKSIHLGYFLDEIDAARAYDKKALEIAKDFAVLNFPVNE